MKINKIIEAFYAPAAKLNRVRDEFSKVDWSKPELQDFLITAIASIATNSQIDDFILQLTQLSSNSINWEIIKKRLRSKNQNRYVLKDDGFTSIDDFNSVAGKYAIGVRLDLTGVKVNSYEPLNQFKSIDGIMIYADQHPIMKLFSQIKIPINNVWIYDKSQSNQPMTGPFFQLITTWKNALKNGKINRHELLKMQTDLINVGDYSDFVTDL